MDQLITVLLNNLPHNYIKWYTLWSVWKQRTHPHTLHWGTAWSRESTHSGNCQGCCCNWRCVDTGCPRCYTHQYLRKTASGTISHKRYDCQLTKHGVSTYGMHREGCMCVCVYTFTNQQDVIVAEAHRTLATEAADLIDACSMGTDPRNLPALVNIWIMTHI